MLSDFQFQSSTPNSNPCMSIEKVLAELQKQWGTGPEHSGRRPRGTAAGKRKHDVPAAVACPTRSIRPRKSRTNYCEDEGAPSPNPTQCKRVREQSVAHRSRGEEESAIREVDTEQGDASSIFATASKESKMRYKELPADRTAIVPFSRYELQTSPMTESGFKYVHRTKHGWQAQPFVNGVGTRGRWHVGIWPTPRQAAIAVSVATAHRCGYEKVKELMASIDESMLSVN